MKSFSNQYNCSTKNINKHTPKHWILSSILEETYGIRGVEGSILAWKIEEDYRPLYVESLISAIHKDNTWQLIHLFRHPHDKNPNCSKWRESMVFDVPYVGSILFDHKPTQEELLKFLDDTWWEFKPDPSWHIHDVGIDIQSWKSLTGENPPSKFLKVIEKTKVLNT